MPARSAPPSARRRTFLLDRAKQRPESFAALRPQIVSSVRRIPYSVSQASKDSLWISFARDLTEALLKHAAGSSRVGSGVFIHPLDASTIPALASCFRRVAWSPEGAFLPPEELGEALAADNRVDLFIGGSVDPATATVTLWRGNLEPLMVPFAAFEPSGDGTQPDFDEFAVTDSGQTIRLGDYEAAADALLYEFDPVYRRKASRDRRLSERSFGASVRRLRTQRGLRREDFAPLSAKTLARIEQGKVERIHPRTLTRIADRLKVKPEEIETY
ncbi:MAG: helix-turn-helix domain-containing protein [Planctomycetes bacterium]|nr:helix-turn-helix domain-containing protein [Planctomycetota bacterium]